MNSNSLKETGFSEASPLKGLCVANLPSNAGNVLILIDTAVAEKTPSDILYIGKTKKPAKRVFGGYLAGFGGKATRKINAKLFDDGYIERIAISWIAVDDPKAKQQELLEKFRQEHGEYPAWNAPAKKASAKPSKPQATAKPAKSAKPRAPRKTAA